MWRELTEVFRYREMLRNLVAKELRARYKGSILGFFWTFANPLLMITIYTVAFKYILRVQQDNYAVFLFVGLLPWNFSAQSLLQGAASMVQGSNLVKKVYFPRSVLPLAVVAANLVNYLLSLIILIPAVLISGSRPNLSLLAFPLILIIQALLVSSISILASIGNVYFRDLEHILSVLVIAWMYLTPIFYSLDNVPQHVRVLFRFNPMTAIIESYRAIFLQGRWPEWSSLLPVGAFTLLLSVVAISAFSTAQRSAAEYL